MKKKEQAVEQAVEQANPMRRRPIVERLKAERVELLVKAMRGWQLTRKPSTIQRVLSFQDPRVAATYGAFVLELGAVQSQDVNVAMKGQNLLVTISRRGGLAQVDLDFAQTLG
ncbi:MAG TPA: hypothetical protein VF789_12860 [Thermoanaerobaculia bacterium]